MKPMKTITIDFALYQTELLSERQRGFDIVSRLKPRLENMAALMNGYSGEDYKNARQALFDILFELNDRPLAPDAKGEK